MIQLTVRCQSTTTEEPCGLCGQMQVLEPGNQLVLVETGAPICADCGKKHAPSLDALVQLASTAERVSKIGRHTVFPPLSALLDLASAAEKYSCAAQSDADLVPPSAQPPPTQPPPSSPQTGPAQG